jgi:hypothetical protein
MYFAGLVSLAIQNRAFKAHHLLNLCIFPPSVVFLVVFGRLRCSLPLQLHDAGREGGREGGSAAQLVVLLPLLHHHRATRQGGGRPATTCGDDQGSASSAPGAASGAEGG